MFLGSVAKFLRGGGGGGDDVAVVKCNERRQAVRRCMENDSGTVLFSVVVVVGFVPGLPSRDVVVVVVVDSWRDSIIWEAVSSVVGAGLGGGSLGRLLAAFHGWTESVNFLGGTGVMGMAFFMSDSFTEGPPDDWALAGEARENPHLVGPPGVWSGLAGGKVAMGGATCLCENVGAVPPMLAL